MQSTYLSRSLFGCTRISFITAALFVGTLALAGDVAAQEPSRSQTRFRNLPPWRSTLPRQRLCMNWYKRQSRRTRRLRPLSTLGRHREMFPSRLRPSDTQLSVQQFSVGSPRLSRATVTAISPTSGSASRKTSLPRQRQLRASVAEHEADSMEARRFNAPNGRGKSQDGLFPPGLHSANLGCCREATRY